jgi:hypothetical protein
MSRFYERIWRFGGACVAALALVGSVAAVSPHVTRAATTSFGSCHPRGTGVYVLPDPRCTPGATYPVVTQATIHRTICVSGWTTKVRPSETYTQRLKSQQMFLYGARGAMSSYEEDHLIPFGTGRLTDQPEELVA